ncbi:hypothetical protein SLE2022_187940 [Rubroshorea leprosula]
MKRGRDDEKIMGPMFPRLHVNDTEKGGPRAPPRNKMALYEQLSIPSQRLNPGVVPLNRSNSGSFVPHGSSSQGLQAEKFHTCQLEGAGMNASEASFEQRKKTREENDFRVPVLNTGMGQRHSRNQNSVEDGKLDPLSRTYAGRSIKRQNARRNPNRSSSSVINLRKEVREQGEESSKVSTRQKFDGPKASPSQDCGGLPASRFISLHGNDDCSRTDVQTKDNGCVDRVESVRDIDNNRVLPQPRSVSHLVEDRGSPDEPNNESECRGVEICALHLVNGEQSDDVSETSMVDSVSGVDISPDDVVRVIGQKHFWKARRAIVNQQRMFAVQVFELHRLIKVQRLIAGSPHLLLEDGAYLGKPSFKGSTAKKLTSEYAVKPVLQIKCKDDSEKPSHKLECSAENAVGRTSLSSVKNGSQPSNYGPYIENPSPAPIPTDNKTNPSCFHQLPGHQWLVPVMSPSEGLVYKPYTGPGFTGTVCGGCGPFGLSPKTGNFMIPAPHNHQYHQGLGFLPGAPPVGQVYFPPYGMPVMNPLISASTMEQMNQFAQPGSHGHANWLSGGAANFNTQQQGSCNLPAENNGAISRMRKSKDTELQGSTASTPSERIQGDPGIGNATEGRNALPLFPMVPAAPEGASQPHDADQQTRVIRVVPHNPRSATESAARIFQSIEEERKQHDSV